MHSTILSVGLIGAILELTTYASPIVPVGGPGPVEGWFAASFLDTTCIGPAFQNFSGSSSSCNVIEDTKPPADFIADIRSVLIGSGFGTYDFSFFTEQSCAAIGVSGPVHTVSSGESRCVQASAGTMDVDNVSTPIARRVRQVFESTYNATFFAGSGCGGTKLETFTGSSSTCRIVHTLLGPPFPPPVESNSVLISASHGSYDFSFFSNSETCQITGVNDEIFPVNSGQSLCVEVSDTVSFNVEDVTS